jgi:hypothetical protein
VASAWYNPHAAPELGKTRSRSSYATTDNTASWHQEETHPHGLDQDTHQEETHPNMVSLEVRKVLPTQTRT